MKWKLSLAEPRVLMYYFMKLIGIAPFTLKNNQFHPPTLLSIIYSCFVALATFSSIIISFLVMAKIFDIENVIGSLQFVMIIHHCVRFASTFSAFLLPWLMHKNILCTLNKLCAIGNEFRNLGVNEDLGKYFKNLLVKTAVANAFFGVLTTAIYSIERQMPLVILLTHAFETWLNFNIVLIFGEMLLFIKNRFKLVNEMLYNEYKPRKNHRSLSNLRMFEMCENRRRIEKLTDLQRIRKIELLHLELSELIEQMTDVFGISIIFKYLQFTIELTTYCYYICCFWQNPDDAGLVDLASILSNVFRVIFISFEVFIIAYASAETCKKGNATKTVLMEVWYDFKPRALVDEFYMFGLQMLHIPVTVSIFRFFDLGYPLLSMTFSTVIAYVIILLQFNQK